METQKKNILKTIAILVIAMVTILLLFLNKITTPRYLSDVELKINGLILVKEKPTINIDDQQTWHLVGNNEKHMDVLLALLPELKPKIKERTQIISSTALLREEINQSTQRNDVIAVINDKNQLIAYFKPPFDQHKMILTYSSIFAHR